MKYLVLTMFLFTSLSAFDDGPESDYTDIRDNASDTHYEQENGIYDHYGDKLAYRQMRDVVLTAMKWSDE